MMFSGIVGRYTSYQLRCLKYVNYRSRYRGRCTYSVGTISVSSASPLRFGVLSDILLACHPCAFVQNVINFIFADNRHYPTPCLESPNRGSSPPPVENLGCSDYSPKITKKNTNSSIIHFVHRKTLRVKQEVGVHTSTILLLKSLGTV